MVDDLLERFRRGIPSPGAGAAPIPAKAPAAPAREEYVAFKGKDKTPFLDIRMVKPPFQSPRYNLLVNVAHDGAFGTTFMMTFTTMSVLVRGRNLQDIVLAIQNGMAAFIQEFDGDKWPRPTNEKAPFIENIEVHFHGSGDEVTKH